MLSKAMNAALASPSVQMMLTWTFANTLRKKTDSVARIDHWAAGMSHGIAVRSSSRKTSVTIGYHGVITFWDAAESVPQISDVWSGVPLSELNSSFAGHVAGLLPNAGRQTEVPVRPAERVLAYELIAALLRLSTQRGYGWRCHTAVDYEGWGVIEDLVRPYTTHIELPTTTDRIEDWSFIVGPTGAVCAVDPEHSVMFPDGMIWPLMSLTNAPPWRAAWAIASATSAKAVQDAPLLGLQQMGARLVDPSSLWVHEALGGRIVDHHVSGPMPVIAGPTRSALQKASGLKIPADALAINGAALRQFLALLEGHYALGKVPTTTGAPFDMLVLWDRFVHANKGQPAGLLGVTNSSRLSYAAAGATANLGNASLMWQEHVEATVLLVDGAIERSGAFNWVLERSAM